MNKQTQNIIPFRLQAGYVVGIEEAYISHNSLESLFGDIFSQTKEYCVLTWNGIPFLLHYTQDIPAYITPLAQLLHDVYEKQASEKTYEFHSNTCMFSLTVGIVENDLILTANFKKVRGAVDEALNAAAKIQMNRILFLYEWKLLLEQILEGFDQSKRELKDHKGKQIIAMIRNINDQIERPYRYQYHLRNS